MLAHGCALLFSYKRESPYVSIVPKKMKKSGEPLLRDSPNNHAYSGNLMPGRICILAKYLPLKTYLRHTGMLLRIGYDVSLTDVASYCIFFLASTTFAFKIFFYLPTALRSPSPGESRSRSLAYGSILALILLWLNQLPIIVPDVGHCRSFVYLARCPQAFTGKVQTASRVLKIRHVDRRVSGLEGD